MSQQAPESLCSLSSPHGEPVYSGCWVAFFVALISTTLFFYPSLSYGGYHTGYVMAGDTWHASIAGFFAVKYYITHGIFSGLDLFTHGGSSEYFLRPNYPTYYPLLLALTPIVDIHHPKVPMAFYVWFECIHAYFCAFFLHRLCVRFLKFDGWISAFVVIGYTFSLQFTRGLWFLPLCVSAWLMPVSIYAGLAFVHRPSWRGALLASLPPFLIYTSGYFPAAVASIGLSTAFILLWQIHSSILQTFGAKLRAASLGILPTAIATGVIAPYYWAAAIFHKTVEITGNAYAGELKAVAHDLAERPEYLPRFISEYLSFQGPLYEFALIWGLVPLLIVIIYFVQLPPPTQIIHESKKRNVDQTLLRASAIVYFILVLAIFGSATPVSNFFYYFIPIIGDMHIYQRYLIFGHFFFILFTALMLQFIVTDPSRRTAKILAAIITIIMLAATQVADRPLLSSVIINGPFVIECLMALLFLLAFITFDRRGAIATATVFMLLMSLSKMYESSNAAPEQYDRLMARHIELLPKEANKLVAYFHASSTKPIIKYIDISPDFHTYISKNLPWFLLQDIKLSGYYGYETHLGADNKFRQLMGVSRPSELSPLIMHPDWEWLRSTGAEFVIFQDNQESNDPHLMDFADLSNPNRVLHLTGIVPDAKDNNVQKTFTIAPLKFAPIPGDPVVFDNGYVRIRSIDTQARVSDFHTNNAGKINFTIESSQPAHMEYLFWPSVNLHTNLDGREVDSSLQNRLMTVTIPAGRHVFKMYYQNIPVTIFLVLYAIYAVLLLLVAGETCRRQLLGFYSRHCIGITCHKGKPV